MKGKTQTYYDNNPRARAVKLAYDKAYQKQKDVKEYQKKLKRKKPAGPGKDNAHTGNGDKTVAMPSSKNRANNRPMHKQTSAKGMNKPEKMGLLYRKFNTQATKEKRKKRKNKSY